MAFLPTKESPVQKHFIHLVTVLGAKGLDMSQAKLQNWEADLMWCVGKAGDVGLTRVIDQVGKDFNTRVRSASALRRHWNELVARSGALFCRVTIHPLAAELCKRRPLKWPWDDEDEAAWVTLAAHGIEEDLSKLDLNTQIVIGSVWHATSQWRIQNNTFSWQMFPKCSSFGDIRYVTGRDYTLKRIIEEHESPVR